MFSVIIPLYNKENSIGNTVQSVLNQSFADFEIVIVNDGSTDNSLEVVQQINDSRIRIIDKSNGGVSSARNYGIKNAEKEWIAFLDGDDLWEIDHLKTISELIEKYPEDKVFCTSFIRSNQKFPANQNYSIKVIANYFDEAINYHFFWTSIAVVKKEVFNQVGNFKEFLHRGEDLDLWARIGQVYRFIKSNRVTAIYVQDSENKLSFTNYNINNSFISNIEFKNKTQKEKKYLRSLLRNRLKSAIVSKNLDIIKFILTKYKFKIFF
ncbi:glycosyltransferase family 2 protein [Chryseobacterium cheonjiense]|uniref:Glycosyltransferase family 2 protein n=1 Tax=Chryseobacterium cheonjiense TaxID=2728845 RepID=A0A7Y0A587_9FLAO|nr:glycosyltransferase family A protein [Chryseobacterium cheonjiense]NML56924.1 glycosyltransferase family 2 protein [Chryseobacterium cheonjiense]